LLRIKGFFTNSAGILTSRVVGFIRDFTTASILGANIYSDIFFVAFKLPNLLRHIFAEGAFAQAFMPSFAAARFKGRFAMQVFMTLLGVIALLSLVVTLFSEVVTAAIAWGFDAQTRALAAPLVAINFYYLNFIFVATFLAALLQYRKHFAVAAFSTALLNLSMIAALLLARDREAAEIVYFLSFGVLVGGVLQVAVHLLAVRRLRLWPLLIGGVKKKRDVQADTGRFKKSFIPAIFGASTIHISAFVDTVLASFLAAGSISYLYYANRIFQLPLALFAIAISMALFPVIARAIARKDRASALASLEKSFWVLLFLLSGSMVGGMMLSDGLIWLLFERGAFERSDTLMSGGVLFWYMVGLLPFGLARIFSLWLYSNHQQTKAAKIAGWSLGVNVLFSLALIGPMGAPGLALASSIGGMVLLLLSVNAFGWQPFWGMIRLKWLALLAGALLLEVVVIGLFKEWVGYEGLFL
jgi:putative peptidoglycan lipid II flippase